MKIWLIVGILIALLGALLAFVGLVVGIGFTYDRIVGHFTMPWRDAHDYTYYTMPFSDVVFIAVVFLGIPFPLGVLLIVKGAQMATSAARRTGAHSPPSSLRGDELTRK